MTTPKPEPMTAERLAEIVAYATGKTCFSNDETIIKEMAAEVTRLKSRNAGLQLDAKLTTDGALALLERAAEMEREIASLKQLLRECPLKADSTLDVTNGFSQAWNDYARSVQSWLDARAKALEI